jgi:hypothetical protein
MKDKPLPPEVLAGALQDRIHPTSGRLLRATPIDTKAIRARADAATAGDQWGQKWDGTLGRGEIRVGPQWGPASSRFTFTAPGFGNAGTAHPDFQLAINAATDLPQLCDRVEALERVLDGLRLVGLDITERADVPNAWTITNTRAAKLDAELSRMRKGSEDCTDEATLRAVIREQLERNKSLEAAITQALAMLEGDGCDADIVEVLRAALGIEVGP